MDFQVSSDMIFIELFFVLGLGEGEHLKEGLEFQKATTLYMTVLHICLDEILVWPFLFAWTFMCERTFIQIGFSYRIRHGLLWTSMLCLDLLSELRLPIGMSRVYILMGAVSVSGMIF